jgi:hypothetical protein
VEDRDMAAFWVVGAFPLLVGAFPLLMGACPLLVEVILRRQKELLLPAKIETTSELSLPESSQMLGRFMAVMINAKSRDRLIDEGKLRARG